MLLKTPYSLSQGVDVPIEHRNGHRGLVWLGADAAASPEDAQTQFHFSHAVENWLMWHRTVERFILPDRLLRAVLN